MRVAAVDEAAEGMFVPLGQGTAGADVVRQLALNVDCGMRGRGLFGRAILGVEVYGDRAARVVLLPLRQGNTA